MENQKENVLINELELEQVKEEAAAAKEELSSYREKAEKLQQELAVRTRLFYSVFKANDYTGLTVQICMLQVSLSCTENATKKTGHSVPTVSGIDLMRQTKSSLVAKLHSFTVHYSATVDLELYFLGDNICYHVS